MKKDSDKYVISKEWYTDPLADSLELENIKCDEIKETILAHKCPEYKLMKEHKKQLIMLIPIVV